jgi:fumarylacetoacetase
MAGREHFTAANLPYGSVRRAAEAAPRLCVALGEDAIELGILAGRLTGFPTELIDAPNLDRLLAADRATWTALHQALTEMLAAAPPPEAVIPLAQARLELPFTVGDYVDFYSSLEHATNLGRLFRPDAEPLLPNWRHLPVGYHGRASTVVVSGTPVRRPSGHRPGPDGPTWGPSRRLDFELELGFVTGGAPNALGEPIAIERAAERIFGFVLVNDWSARDIQAFEYQPLGPFLGKSFMTSISPWVVPLDALEAHRVPGPPQTPAPLPHLRTDAPWNLDLEFDVELTPAGGSPRSISRTNARELYWSAAQQLAHVASNGAVVRPGGVYASGTISGPQAGSEGSMIELSQNGARPLVFEDGAERSFLEDGDTVTMFATSGRGGGAGARIDFGAVSGQVLPAHESRGADPS